MQFPPAYALDGGNDGVTTTEAFLYHAADTSADSIDVYNGGTDYIEFRAGSYFDDGQEHELRLNVRGKPIEGGSTNGIKPIAWVMGYSSSDDTLEVHPEHLVFVEPVTFAPTTTSSDSTVAQTIIVTDFGRAVKAVVLAVGSAGLRPDLNDHPTNGFSYSYAFGVSTPAATSRAWDGDVYALGDVDVGSGGTLNVSPGTRIKIFNSDLSGLGDVNRIEFNVNGALIADGTEANPIVFEPWTPTGVGNWLGFFVNNTGPGATFDHCIIKRAAAAIRSHAPLTITHTDIDTCAWTGIVSKDGGLAISDCTLRAPGYVGIQVEADANTVRNTVVDGALLYALSAYDSSLTSLDVHGSEFTNSDTGLYVYGNVDVNVDSTCYFYQNDTGIKFYNAGTSATVTGAGITWNTSTGVLCDNSSSPRIESSIFSYNGAGIYCTNGSSPIIEYNQMQATGYAVTGSSSSYPDVGHKPPSGSQSTGNNSIAHTGKYVVNSNSSGTIYAQNNCWNKNTPNCNPPSNLFTGVVNRDSVICCSFPRWSGGEGEPDPTMFVFQLPNGSPEPTRRLVTAIVGIVPNPFNPQTTIRYSLASQSRVEIKIYDVAGRLVEVLANETQVAGDHSVVWKGTDRRGSQVASGVYFVRMVAGNQVFTKKMLLLK